MNVRTIFLMSMIFCAAPIVCAASEVSLTKQEQEKIIQWVECVKKLPKLDTVFQTIFSIKRDISLLFLSKLKIGDSSESCQNIADEVMLVFHSQFSDLQQKLIASGEQNNFIVAMNYYDQIRYSIINVNNLKTDDVITESEIAIIKKQLMIESFVLECLGSQEKSSNDIQVGTLWRRLSNNPIKTGLGIFCVGAMGYVLYRLYA